MKVDGHYDKWLASKQAVNVPEGWAGSLMQRSDRYEGSRRRSVRGAQPWMDWFCASMPARAAAVLAGMAVCVTRFVILFLAALG